MVQRELSGVDLAARSKIAGGAPPLLFLLRPAAQAGEGAARARRRVRGGTARPSPSSCRCCGTQWHGTATTTRLGHQIYLLFFLLRCRRPDKLTRSSLGFAGSSERHHFGGNALARGGSLIGDRRRLE
uniref:Uncharacterized protein n=1 Tax=Oryza barthii TaxID=65489 RepID=A0A0D3H4W4_9ORYZ